MLINACCCREFLLMDKRGSDSSAQEIQQELSEIERDLALRRLLWESQEEWESLTVQWKDTAFDSLDVDALQKNVNRFTQTVYMLEKGTHPPRTPSSLYRNVM